jgi:sec-independent protein translocase protein TatB
MFENLNWWEIGALLLLALLIFGDRLPTVIADGLRMVRNLRDMARNATGDLSRELGTDIQLEDLHPKAFIRKHLLSEEDEAALRKPLQGVYDDLRSDFTAVRDDLKDVAASADIRSAGRRSGGAGADGIAANGSTGSTGSGPTGSTAAGPRSASFDLDAT